MTMKITLEAIQSKKAEIVLLGKAAVASGNQEEAAKQRAIHERLTRMEEEWQEPETPTPAPTQYRAGRRVPNLPFDDGSSTAEPLTPREGAVGEIKTYLEGGMPLSVVKGVFNESEMKAAGITDEEIAGSSGIYSPDTGIGRIMELWDVRDEEFTSTLQRQGAGEQSIDSTILQVTGKQLLGRATDVAGVALLDSMKMFIPDFAESTVGEVMLDGWESLMGTDAGVKITETWDTLSPVEQANWQSVGLFATALAPKTFEAIKRVPRPDRMRNKQISDLFEEPQTNGVRKDTMRRLGVRGKYQQAVLDTVGTIKGINPVVRTGGDKIKPNMEAVNRELTKMEAKLQSQLSKITTPLRAQSVKAQILEKTKAYMDDTGESVMAGDSNIASAFKARMNKIDALVDRVTDVGGNIAAKDLIVVRREMDAHVRAINKNAFSSANTSASSAATEVTRNAMLDIVEGAYAGTGRRWDTIKSTMTRYNHVMTAADNLAHNGLRDKTLPEKMRKLAEQHPIMVASGLGLTGGGIGWAVNEDVVTAFTLAAGTYLAGRLVKTGATRAAIAKPVGVMMKPLDEMAAGVSRAMDRNAVTRQVGAMTSKLTPRAVINEGLDRATRENEERRFLQSRGQ